MSSLNQARDADSLVDLLRWRAEQQPQRRAYTFLLDGETEQAHISYAELDLRARMIGAALQQQHAPGSRALLLYPPGLDYIAAFFGCLYAGMIAVPAYPPRLARLERSLPRLQAIALNAQPALILTTADYLSQATVLAQHADVFRAATWIATDELADDLAATWRTPALSHDTLAFLQYTSGSTGTPKGVMLAHGNLLHNLALIEHGFGHSAESHGVIWLPPYHDMGLIGGILQPLYAGFPVTLMSPVAFLQQPLRWLQAISRYGATTSGGPNFAFELCVRKIPPEARSALDLSSWRVAFCGAEPIRHETLERFAAAFAECGFRREALYPCYGLAEATLIVTGGAVVTQAAETPAGSAEQAPRTLVSSGRALLDQRLLIVDPATAMPCQPEQIGEIWIGGPSVAQGYWNDPDATESTFRARPATGEAEPFLRSGDLGFLHDGELFVTGRLKDLIIIRGRNLYPQDIEQTVEQSHAALRPSSGAAFALDVDGGEQLVVVQEVERHYHKLDLDSVVAAIRAAISEQHEVQAYAIVLIKPGTIPKTSSGKIQRFACREAFLAGTLATVTTSVLPPSAALDDAAVLTRADLLAADPADRPTLLIAYLQAVLAAMLGGEPAPLDPHQPVTAYGVDSLAAVELSNRIERDLDVLIPLVSWLEGASIAQLATILLHEAPVQPAEPPAPADAHDSAALPLSYGQRSLWFLHRLDPESTAYNIARAFRLHTDLDPELLRPVFQQLVDRHASLRTTFPTIQRMPHQRIATQQAVAFEIVDVSAWSQAQLDDWLQTIAHQPFDLQHGPLFKIYVTTRASRADLLVLVMQHIIVDFWSLALLAREAAVLLTGALHGRPAVLPAPQHQYQEYVAYQERLLAGSRGTELLSYWEQQLAGAPLVLDLPTDRARPATPLTQGAAHNFRISAELTEQLRLLSAEHDVTLFMTLLAAFATFLFRYSGQPDLLIGSPTAGRSRATFAEIIGYFVNLVALRADCSGDPSFSTLLGRIRETVLGALAHQEYPLPLLVERIQPVRASSRSPLFQVVFSLQQSPAHGQHDLAVHELDIPGARLDLGALSLETLEIPQQTAQFDLLLTMTECQGRLEANFKYSTQLFDADTIRRMADQFQVLLTGIVAQPDQWITRLPLLTATDREYLLRVCNQSDAAYPRDATAAALFEAQAARTPDTVAVVYDGQQLSYDHLNTRANQLAHHLHTLGVGSDVPVALCAERSVAMLVAIVAVLKAGGCYVPLDPAYPAARLQFMLQTSRAPVLLTEAALRAALPATSATIVCLDSDWPTIAQQPTHNPVSLTHSEHIAYIIFTSGSTGQPKGVMVPQRGLVNLAYGLRAFFDDPAVRQTGLITSISFDISVNQIFPTLFFGRTLHIIPDAVKFDSPALLHYLDAHAIHLLDAVPSYLQATLAAVAPAQPPHALRYLLVGGEKLEARLLDAVFGQLGDTVAIVNIYGLTELSDVNAFGVIRAEHRAQPITVGRPLQNNRIYIVNEAMEPQPVGVTGEVCVAGESVSRGYLAQPALSAERFVVCPFEDGARMGRTGDLGRWLSDGTIEILGRIDQQVKLRGFRIEIGEIEAVLLAQPGVRDAVVVLREDQPGEQRLVAYVVEEPRTKNQEPGEGSEGTTEQRNKQGDAVGSQFSVLGSMDGSQFLVLGSSSSLRRALQAQLPSYMLPSVFVVLAELPKTPSGKIDRRALPAPPRRSAEVEANVTAPRTPTEQAIAEIWASLLDRRSVGIHDDFFALGGHSLLATQVINRLREVLGVELPLRMLFEQPTVAGLAVACAQLADRGASQPTPDPYPLGHEAALPLSFAQQGVWFLQQLEPTSTAYNIPAVVRLVGPLDVDALAASLQQIMQRHDALRTRFLIVANQPAQVIDSDATLTLVQHDLTALSPVDQAAAVAEQLAADAPFDLTIAPLLRAVLLRLAAQEHVLLLTLHHLVADGWSLGVLLNELAALYPAVRAQQPSPLAPLPLQYADVARWQRQQLQGSRLAALEAYWTAQLADPPAPLHLPATKARPVQRTGRAGQVAVQLDLSLTDQLQRLSQQHHATLFMTLLTAFQVLLARLSGQWDLAVGTPVAQRTHASTEPLIGMFVNMLVLRSDLHDQPRFSDALARVRQTTLDAFAHQDYPFELLVERLQPARVLGSTPLIQVVFALQNAPLPPLQLADVVLSLEEMPATTAKFALTLMLRETADGLDGTLEYATDLLDAADAERLVARFTTLLQSVVAQPELPITRLPLLPAAEQQRVLHDWNRSDTDYPQETVFHELFEAQAARTPDVTALVLGDEQLSYGELNARANQLARVLQQHGVGPDTLVALYIQRSLAMIVAILAIHKAGGCYVPLDPAYPAERLRFMLHDTAAPVVLTEAALLATLPPHSAHVLCLDRDWPTIAQQPDANLPRYNLPQQRAYVIYTSGSTGRPKGVMVTQGGLLNLCFGLRAYFDDPTVQTTGLITSISFDISVNQIFPTLLFGRTLHIISDTVKYDGRALFAYLDTRQIHLLDAVPSYLQAMLAQVAAAQPPNMLRYLLIGGEKLEQRLLDAVFGQLGDTVAIVNIYGLTEISDINALGVLRAADRGQTITVGRPLQNNRIYILGPDDQPQPIGVVGEVCVTGNSVSRGYLNRPALTAEKFVACPFEDGTRMCRTGDLGRWRADGTIEILGRIDQQVKVRGFRIEIGEIEAALIAQPSVRDAVVVLREDQPGEQRLVAYVIEEEPRTKNQEPRDGEREPRIKNQEPGDTADGFQFSVLGSAPALRRALQAQLPDYMLPSVFVALPELPKTPNGKIDRRALPAPTQLSPELEANVVAPRTPTEQQLATIWCDVLGIASVGVEDNFFELGGHSLLATQIVEQIRETFGVTVGVRSLFDQPTIAAIAPLIDAEQSAQAEPEDLDSLVAMIEQLSPEEIERLIREKQQ